MEDNNVVGVVEVLGQGVDVLTAQPVGHEHRRPVSVCPVDPILQPTHSCCLSGLFFPCQSLVLEESPQSVN